ncbi:MAG: hypothetical protein ACI33J_07750 [Clostridium sp.]
MKKLIKYFSVIVFILLLNGCSTVGDERSTSIKAPNNNDLEIVGVWSVQDYEVLDDNLFSEEELERIKSNDVIIKSDKIILGEKLYKESNYKLKVVKNDYVISYEAKYSLDNLSLDSNYINVYSIMHQNNILGEFIYFSKEKSYFYYEGILFSLKYKNEVNDNNDFEDKKQKGDFTKTITSNKAQGILLGLKTPMINENGTYQRESYRTLWISLKNSKLQDVKQKEYILVPRSNGFWKIESKVYSNQENNIYYEYFFASVLENEYKEETAINYIIDTSSLDNGSIVYKKINYVGTNYIATEEVNNSKYISDFYKILPIDNLYLNDGVVIQDIYDNDIINVYKQVYEEAYRNLDYDKKEELSKYLDYSNFTVVRNNGKWMLQGMISGLNGAESVEYPIGIKANNRLTSYDTLYVPWKSLKNELPFMVDVYMSPSGRLAIILNKEEILVYLIEDGKILEEPLRKIPLKDGESVIMAEWCEKDYVDKWESVFKDDTIIPK